MIEREVAAEASEIAWRGWLPEPALREALERWPSVPGRREAYGRCTALPAR
ncbi:hypothetical protein OG762_00865 [Streptomyces sp. NBC_01136]|uniref:hypothetical protein n=1 Tax=unclassified Streptomyces TaxID=2593676 RepID=UPI003244F03E|nr:hypothetical protein OG762_00865 [Streptomyces sp. NBC_01136]